MVSECHASSLKKGTDQHALGVHQREEFSIPSYVELRSVPDALRLGLCKLEVLPSHITMLELV